MSVMEISMIDIRKRLVFLKLGRKKELISNYDGLPLLFDVLDEVYQQSLQ